jgi:hypothetical protein
MKQVWRFSEEQISQLLFLKLVEPLNRQIINATCRFAAPTFGPFQKTSFGVFVEKLGAGE